MNKYGAMAREHWTKHRAADLATVTDQDSFFSTLSEQVSDRVSELELQILEQEPSSPGEDHFVTVGRNNMARLQAEEIALAELVFLEPQETETEEPLPAQWQAPSAQETVSAVAETE